MKKKIKKYIYIATTLFIILSIIAILIINFAKFAIYVKAVMSFVYFICIGF